MLKASVLEEMFRGTYRNTWLNHPNLLYFTILLSITLERRPNSAVDIATCEVHVSATDSHTVPAAATGVAMPLCCELINPGINTDQWEPIAIYHSINLMVVIKLCSPRCWHLDSNYCRTRCRQPQLRFVLSPLLLHLPQFGTLQSDIPLFTLTWPAKHSPNHRWESTHRLHLYPQGDVFYSP